MSVLLIVVPKCTLTASYAAPGESRWVCRWNRQTDGRTDGRHTVTLRFPLDAASLACKLKCVCTDGLEKYDWL